MPDLNELFESKRKKVSLEKKKVGVFSVSVEYKWDNNVQNFSPEDYHYHEVRKRIANVCYGNMIKPGIYRGQEANQIIRAMQKAIIEDFEGEVSKYSWSELHYLLLDYHSTLLHDIDINWKRYGSYSGLDEKKDKEVRDRIIDQREKAKHDDRNTLYLIETNLYLHCESETLATIDDINLLLAYANWLVVLNDVADMCHFADNEAYIEITDEYVVDTLADDQDAEALSGLHHRIYSYSGGLKRDHETDFKYLEKVKETFKEDMGFDLTDFLDILSYFSNSFSETIVKKIGNNVFRAPMKELLRDFLEQMNNVITEEDAATLFNYLVVSSQNLKTENGKINFYLPIGKRRTRDTRFELMPLVSINGDIIFSPITMDRLKKDWLNGIMDFILPYEVRMNKTKQLIVEWKKSYEKQIVYDIANSFKKNKFDIIKQNFELMKLNKSHPQWLGDYDVFAVDINNKSIWIVECKVIEKVATFYDMYRQQNRFFNEHKEDEKFQRRIDYLRENADQVIQQLGCTDYIGYKVIPYWSMRYREEFQNLGLRIILTSGLELTDFEITYIQDCLRKDPYEDGGMFFDTMLDGTLYGGIYNLDIYLGILFGLKNKDAILNTFHTISARNNMDDRFIPEDFMKYYNELSDSERKLQIQKIAELFLLCFKLHDKDKQEELEDFFYNLPTHDKVQNDMILEMRIACGLEVKDYE